MAKIDREPSSSVNVANLKPQVLDPCNGAIAVGLIQRFCLQLCGGVGAESSAHITAVGVRVF